MKAPPASAISQQDIIASLPVHLRPFVETQDYEHYTARDQAVWRFTMKQLTRQLEDTAHPVYLEGLARNGISLEHITSIDEMNACLAQLNWRAVVVDGFTPPAIFMEFQALKVLAIALNIRSGAESLKVAIDAATVCTAQYDSGIQVSGVFTEVLSDALNNAIYLRTSGPTQLACDNRELDGHGVEYHSEGFGSPVGHLKDFSRCLSLYSIDELQAHNIVVGERVRLEYLSGVVVQGRLRQIHRQEQRNLLLEFDECTVTDLDGRVLFDPAWGTYDMAVGSAIKSVYDGVADRESLQL